MCRNIKNLYNFSPPATDDEVYASSLQYVRKISGFQKPSKINETIFQKSVEEIATITKKLVQKLKTDAPSKNREDEAEKARVKYRLRFNILKK